MEEITILRYLRLLKQFLFLKKDTSLSNIENFVRDFYGVENMPTEFYMLIKRNIKSKKLFKVITTEDIYKLISYLKYNNEPINEIHTYLSPEEYFDISKRQVNKLIMLLKEMPKETNILEEKVSEHIIWKLRRRPTHQDNEYQELAYKLYQIIGFENSTELIQGHYGSINYEQIHHLIKNIEPINLTPEEKEIIKDFLISNKKDFNNPIRQMLSGNFCELFLNFDYFYNDIKYFINKIGSKLPQSKLRILLNERFLTSDPTTPEITGEIKEDMLSSYYHRYDTTDASNQYVIDKNTKTYISKLRNKFSSSIPQIPLTSEDEISIELLDLSDPRNLTHGYRSGNCFRLNGDASILFSKFLDSEHMRILSFSTPEYKDYAMVLLMRNGNVLIAQGIETSKWVPAEIKGKRLYNATKNALKEIMDYMNLSGDEIAATIIGATNENVTTFNTQILPFLVGPIIENSSNYYNGISNYQCLLNLAPRKTIYDMKAYEPQKRYFDKRSPILARKRNCPEQEIERRIISLRYQRSQTEEGFSFYEKMFNHQELETICNKDWYITLYTDNTIDSFLAETKDPRAQEEYSEELAKVYKRINSSPPKF